MTTNFYSLYKRRSIVLSENAQYFFILLIILISANSLKIITDEFIIGVFIFTLFLFLLKKRNIDTIIIYLFCAWGIINLVSFIFNRTSFDIWTFTGFIVKMIYPYFILKLVGETFFEKFEKVVFALTVISLPLYAIQILLPGVINSFTPIFKNITSEEILHSGGWYSIIFRFNASSELRNSGFMWEPGAFAFMILLALLFRIMKNGLVIDKRNIIYIIALITTLSTMAYLGIAILLLAYSIKSKNVIAILITIPVVFTYFSFVSNLSFMLPKMQDYLSTLDQSYTPGGKEYLKVNRVAFLLFILQESVLFPLGYGIVPSKYMYSEFFGKALEGVGTIANLLLYWGWLGLIFFIRSFYKYFKCLQIERDGVLLLFAAIILILAFFSNPFEKDPIFYSIVFYPFIFKNINTEYV